MLSLGKFPKFKTSDLVCSFSYCVIYMVTYLLPLLLVIVLVALKRKCSGRRKHCYRHHVSGWHMVTSTLKHNDFTPFHYHFNFSLNLKLDQFFFLHMILCLFASVLPFVLITCHNNTYHGMKIAASRACIIVILFPFRKFYSV